MGIAGMVLGIVGLVFAFIPVVGAFIAFPCIAVGLPLAIIAFFRGYRDKQGTQGSGFAVAGMVCNTVALFIVIIWLAALGSAVSEVESELGSNIFTAPSLGGGIDQSVKNSVGMMGPRPTDAEIRSACTALRNAGWDYYATSNLNQSNRTLTISAALTTYASGSALREYCNSK